MFVTKSARLVLSRSNHELLQRCFSKDALTGAKQHNWSSKIETSRCASINTNRSFSSQIDAATREATAIEVARDNRALMAVFPEIVSDLTDASKTRVEIHEDVREWYANVLQYNIPKGKQFRGISAVLAYKMIVDPKELTPENVHLINILGWCIEVFQSGFLITDDIVDQSDLRRGIPCWHKVPGVGNCAIFDAILVSTGTYSILHKYFSKRSCYVPLIEAFHEVTLRTAVGQALDGLCKKDGIPNLDKFTMSRYEAIVENKSGYYSFKFPVEVAMHFAGMHDPELHNHARTISMKMGVYCQARDDFLDCFGKTSITGKMSIDIREGKCSWLVVQALERANPEQRKLLTDHYGKPERESIQLVTNLYKELGLREKFAIYEKEIWNDIRNDIHKITDPNAKNLFIRNMEPMYQKERYF